MRFSDRTTRTAGGGGAWEIHADARRRQATGEDVFLLTVGDPDQAPSPVIIEATIDSLRRRRTGYSATAGLPAVRAAIAARIARRTGVACRDANVIVVPGAQAGLYCAVQCIAGPGDEIIVPEPMYSTYPGVIAAAGATMVNVKLRPDHGFHPDIAALSDAITPRTRALWINSPHNPTGAVLDAAEMHAIAEICRRHDLWLLSDEVYEDLAFARSHLSAWSLPGMADRAIVVSSLSKSHAIPGYRFGWVAAPEPLIAHATELVLSMLYGGPPFIQDGVLPALTHDLPEVDALRADYQRRAISLSRILAATRDCTVLCPEGGMFVLIDVRRTGLTASRFARSLLDQEAVAVLPCDSFGPSAAGHVRVSLTATDARLEEAGRRIVRFTQTLALALESASRSR